MESFIRNGGEFNKVVEEISDAAGRGKSKCFCHDLSKVTQNKLTKLGYTIKKSGDTTIIGWAE